MVVEVWYPAGGIPIKFRMVAINESGVGVFSKSNEVTPLVATGSVNPSTTTTTSPSGTGTVATTTTTTNIASGGVKTSFGNGTFRVNVNITPGRYMSNRSGCYWARLSGFSGNLSDIIANENVPGSHGIVDIKSGDAGFQSSGCGAWTLFQASGRGTIADGFWKVNGDIAPGMWQTTSASSC